MPISRWGVMVPPGVITPVITPSHCWSCPLGLSNQRSEMQIPVCQLARLKLPGLPCDRGGQRARDDGIQGAVSVLDPCAVQRAKTRRAKGASRAFESLIAAHFGTPSRLEEPSKFIQLRWPKWRAELLSKGVLVAISRMK